MYMEKNPLCCKVIPLWIQKCCRASFCPVEKQCAAPLQLSGCGTHWRGEGPVPRGAVSVVSKQVLDVLELQGCVHSRVEVKGASSKPPSSLPCSFFFCLRVLGVFFVPPTCPLFYLPCMGSHAFTCLVSPTFCFRFTSPLSLILLIHPCSPAPCSSLWHEHTSARTRARAQGGLAAPGAGSTGPVWVGDGRAPALPSQEQGSGGTSLWTQQTSTEHKVSHSLLWLPRSTRVRWPSRPPSAGVGQGQHE